MTAALSEYATTVPRGCARCVARIIANRLCSCATPSTIQSALKILCRQCSEFACANIVSSTSVGSRPSARKLASRYSISSGTSARPKSALAASSARRPCARSGTVVSGRGGTCANNRAASATSSNTASIIRSCTSGSSAARSPAASGAPSRLVTRYPMPRSMRVTAVRPQLCAMSVAFDDQGEIVPGRGTTSNRVPVAAVSLPASGPYVKSRSSVVRSEPASGRRSSTKCQYVAAMPAIRWTECVWERLCSSLARRNGVSAGRPANERISGIALGERVKADSTPIARDYCPPAAASGLIGVPSRCALRYSPLGRPGALMPANTYSTLPMRLTTSAIFAASAST